MSKYILSDIQTRKISTVIKYVKKFKGCPYKKYCSNQGQTKDAPPFWVENKELPAFDFIYKKGLVCAGLANIARRYMKLEVPGNITGMRKSTFIGGTYAWFIYLKNKKRLEKINFEKQYPKGTLLLQNYNPKDQGHVAISINSSKRGLLQSKIVHAINGTWNGKKYNCTVIEKLNDYPYYNRFTHICLPQNWLLKN
tara:strand:+ start:1338 stop:1925 length:588 start_codon:yes stop_codon:yes gene_type:complete